jgi:hypothetical protein
LEKLVYFKLRTLNLLKRAHAAVHRYGGLIENKYGDDDERNVHVGITAGENPEDKSCLKVNVQFNNDDVKKTVEEYTGALDELNTDGVCVVLRLGSEDPETAEEEL